MRRRTTLGINVSASSTQIPGVPLAGRRQIGTAWRANRNQLLPAIQPGENLTQKRGLPSSNVNGSRSGYLPRASTMEGGRRNPINIPTGMVFAEEHFPLAPYSARGLPSHNF